ncbi:tannase/feruloyl esterase family alpha/beta hydrolase [Streptomyces sp. NPDC058642]|uniref:tannase/feruloyl esterase family alpha/beta hydrolase n=1 Tax=Streptomyces sp. NPDC058642 TaxID=3346572 RepID=UPI00365C258D
MFTAKDATVVKKIWDGPRRQDGTSLWPGQPRGASFGTTAVTSGSDRVPNGLTNDWYRYWLAKNPGWDWHSVTMAHFPDYFDWSCHEWGEVVGTNDIDLTAFRATGGRLILWHGSADELIGPEGTIGYYQQVMNAMGGKARTEQFARLFMAPSVGHCYGGADAIPADPLAALVR